MAKCDQGYLCQVCQQPVSVMTESELYLRYIIGEIDRSQLLSHPDRHLTCATELSQYIVHADFPEVTCDGVLDKRELDDASVKERETIVTQGWLRLMEVAQSDVMIQDYPLAKVSDLAE